MLTEEQAVKAFEITAEYFYRAGVLYAISETGEGYLSRVNRCIPWLFKGNALKKKL